MAAPIPQPDQLRTAWLVNIQLADNYVLYFCSGPADVTYNGQTYTASPILAGVGRLADNIRSSDSTLDIAFVGVNIALKQTLLTANDVGLGGRPVNVYRVYYDNNWTVNSILPRYFGVINSVTFEDNWPTDASSTLATFNVLVSLKSQKEILKNRLPGRFTSQADMQKFFPSDTSFNGLPALRDRVIFAK